LGNFAVVLDGLVVVGGMGVLCRRPAAVGVIVGFILAVLLIYAGQSAGGSWITRLPSLVADFGWPALNGLLLALSLKLVDRK
jgi:hypothetical protein